MNGVILEKSVLVAAILCLAVVSCTHAVPKPVKDESLQQIAATVTAVDPPARALELTGPQGDRALVIAGPEVRNFDQIRTGDRVIATYYQAIAADVRPRGRAGVSADESNDNDQTEASVLSRAPPGERPAAAAGRSIATTVKIKSVDTSFNTVTFERADGITRIAAVEKPDAQRFIRQLRPGDEVQITYTEATAVTVAPASR
jgi:hypothetical protein